MDSPLRVVLVTQEDPFYIAEFFRAFLRERSAHSQSAEFVGAFILDTLGERGSLGLFRRMHALYGNLGVSRLAVRYAFRTARSIAHTYLRMGRPVLVRHMLSLAGIPTWRTSNINGEASLARLRALSPDILLSISATQKFSSDLLGIPRLGCFNSHSGALPRFRGMMPTFWTLFEGETVATVTIHRMAEKIDAGMIWRQASVPIDSTASLDDVIRDTKRLSATAMWELLEAIHSGPIDFLQNDVSKGSYYHFPTRSDSAALRKRGRRLL